MPLPRPASQFTQPNDRLRPGQSVWEQIGGRIPKPVRDVAKTAFAPVAWGLDKAETGYRNVIAEPISTGYLATNPYSSTFGNLRASYREAQEVSPGQAFLASPLSGGSGLGALNQVGTGVENAIYDRPDRNAWFDPTDEKARKTIYEDTFTGRWVSGGTDAVLRWYTDPLVVGGKVARGVRFAVRGIDPATARGSTTIDRWVAAKINSRLDVEQRQWDAIQEMAAKNADAIANGTVTARRAELLRSRLVRKSDKKGLAATLFADVTDPELLWDIYLASRGSSAHWERLAQRQPVIADKLKNARGDYRRAGDVLVDAAKVLPDGTLVHADDLTRATGEFDAAHAAYYALVREDHLMAKAVGIDMATGIHSATRGSGISPFAPVRAWDAKKAAKSADRVTGAWATATFGGGQYGRVARVLSWLGSSTPSGIITVKGAGVTDAGEEILAAARKARVEQDLTRSTYVNFHAATSPASRVRTIEDFEHNAVAQIVREELGHLTDDVEQLNRIGDEIIEVAQRRRRLVMSRTSKDHFWLDENNDWVTDPFFATQQGDYLPMLDLAEYRLVIRMHGSALVRKTHNALDQGELYLGAFTDLWKAAALLRLGYTTRNLADSWIAAMIAYGRPPGNPAAGIHRSLYNNAQRWRVHRENNKRARSNTAAVLKRDEVEQARLQLKEQTVSRSKLEQRIDRATDPSRTVSERMRVEANTEYLDDLGMRSEGVESAAAHRELDDLRRQRRNLTAQLDRATKPGSTTGAEQAQQVMDDLLEVEARLVNVDAKRIAAARKQVNAEMQQATRPGATTVLVPKPSPMIVEEQQRFLAHLDDLQDNLDEVEASIVEARQIIREGDEILASWAPVSAPGLRGAGTAESTYRYRMPDGTNLALILPASLGGTVGDSVKAFVGATHTFDIQAITDNARLAALNQNLKATGAFERVIPENRNEWSAALAHVMSHQVRADDIGKMVLEGKDLNQIVKAMEETHWGLRMGHRTMTHAELEEEALKMITYVERYLPDEQMRRTAAQRDLTPEEIREWAVGREDLVPVHGHELREAMTAGGSLESVAHEVSGITQKLYNALGTWTEDRLARWPLFDTQYRTHLQAMINDNIGFLSAKTLDEANEHIRTVLSGAARQAAANDVRRAMYTVDRRGTLASKMRFISPFFQATQNRLAFYGSQMVESPDRMARLLEGWDNIGHEEDQFGKPVDVVTIPAPAAKLLGLGDGEFKFTKSSINVVAPGQPWWNPGAGPMVTVPVGELVRRNSKYVPEPLKKLVLPYGPGDNPAEQWLPTWMDRMLEITQGQDSKQWANSYSREFVYQTYLHENGYRDTAPTPEEIGSRINTVWFVRSIAALTLPANPQMPPSPLQPHIDQMRKWIADPAEGGLGYEEGTARFMREFPEFFDYVTDFTDNPTQINPTATANARAGEYSHLIEQMTAGNPEMIGLVTNMPGDDEYDTQARAWQEGRRVSTLNETEYVSRVGPEEAVRSRQRQRGWTQFLSEKAGLDAYLVSAGYTDKHGGANLNKAPRAIRDAWYERRQTLMAENVAWADDYLSQDKGVYQRNARTLALMLSDEKYMTDNARSTVWLDEAYDYLANRSGLAEYLRTKRLNGKSADLTANDNRGLFEAWESYRSGLAARDPQWAEVMDRFFANDYLGEIA